MVAGIWAGLRPAESRAGAGASARRGWEKWRGIVAAGDPGPGPGRSGAATASAQLFGRAHVCTSVTNAQLVCRLLLDKTNTTDIHYVLHISHCFTKYRDTK